MDGWWLGTGTVLLPAGTSNSRRARGLAAVTSCPSELQAERRGRSRGVQDHAICVLPAPVGM